MKTTRSLVLALFVALFAGCATEPSGVRVSELVATPSPASIAREKSSELPKGVPSGARLVKATVTDVRLAPELLVELSDPGGTAHAWAAGFVQAPERGAVVWTAIVGPPVANDLVGVVYPSTGLLPAPAPGGITRQGALAVVVGGLALASGLALVVANLVGGGPHRRRCGGCGQGVDEGWITCAACGHSLEPPAAPPPPEILEAQPPPLPPPAPTAAKEPEPSTSSVPTRIGKTDDPSWPA